MPHIYWIVDILFKRTQTSKILWIHLSLFFPPPLSVSLFPSSSLWINMDRRWCQPPPGICLGKGKIWGFCWSLLWLYCSSLSSYLVISTRALVFFHIVRTWFEGAGETGHIFIDDDAHSCIFAHQWIHSGKYPRPYQFWKILLPFKLHLPKKQKA